MSAIPSHFYRIHPIGNYTSSTKIMDIDIVISEINGFANNLKSGGQMPPRQQERLLEACDRLSMQLKNPEQGFTATAAVKIAIDMGIFDLTINRDPEEITAEEIANSTGADQVLVVERIMRSQVINGLLNTTPQNKYAANEATKALSSQGSMQHMVSFIHNVTACVSQKLPEFLAKTGYRNPNSSTDGPFQYTFNTSNRFYTWLQKHPELHVSFNGMMKATERQDVRWSDIFPAEDRFAVFRGPQSQVLHLVDVAGGTGYNIQHLVEKIPDLHARFTLQDLPEVIAAGCVPVAAQVEVMPHDIFQTQPVTGAHVYILKRILHNWPDQECRQILGHLRDAMGPDSVVLIHDRVFPDEVAGMSKADVSIDLAMMMLCGSMERTEAQFRTLFASVGLRMVRVWRGPAQSQDAVVEAVLAEK
ncbi:S-adenosyl-L-methionine-dependent methyltransferase [Aspergillus sclerotioniger CBS 115572]|uniref:S-adenosyl-L-methionine-dependent methyltransferase n=1 Tax=Aspergillus sclerotioniger CBS 115572 TaxID=1450535 RepID=A0A317UYN4_9EURO|nr:S-adenosyl-L-methionine-dependent methyltransferase [Aspergillus sclerotioniger CBS 115572]PWY66469.1 S-adenosyl-L-methionine-dependent methyltransferase [Aspergillus sclerotioniger CBS 115572]